MMIELSPAEAAVVVAALRLDAADLLRERMHESAAARRAIANRIASAVLPEGVAELSAAAIDTATSASRQHFIETGEYLRAGEACVCGPYNHDGTVRDCPVHPADSRAVSAGNVTTVALNVPGVGSVDVPMSGLVWLLGSVTAAFQLAPWPRLVETPATEDEPVDEDYPFTCPHCKRQCGVRAEDMAFRSSGLSAHMTRRTVSGSYDDHGEYDWLFYSCSECSEPVRLPDGWAEL